MKEKNIRRNAEGKIIVDRAYMIDERKTGSVLTFFLFLIPLFNIFFIILTIKNARIRRALATGNFTVEEDIIINKDTESHISDDDHNDATTYSFNALNSGKDLTEEEVYEKIVPGETVWVVYTDIKKKNVTVGTYPCSSYCLAEEVSPYVKPLSESDKERAAQKIAEARAAEAQMEEEIRAWAEKVTCPSCGKTYRPYKHPNGCPKCGTPRIK